MDTNFNRKHAFFHPLHRLNPCHLSVFDAEVLKPKQTHSDKLVLIIEEINVAAVTCDQLLLTVVFVSFLKPNITIHG